MKDFFRLFAEFFKISLFVVGGGYAIISVADEVFSKLGWTDEGELIDQLPVMQMAPGLIATHCAVYVGSKRFGWKGAAVAVFAVALPSVVLFTIVSAGYALIPVHNAHLASCFVGLRSALTGIILAALVKSGMKILRSPFAIAMYVAALAALALGVRVPIVLVTALAIGLMTALAPSAGDGKKTFCSVAALLPLLLFLKYGALCFGGGFVLVPMYIEDFVGTTAHYLQITTDDFANLMALTQVTPGPIGVNGATYFGYRLFGVVGAVAASACLLLPGSLLAFVVFKSLARFRESRIVSGLMRGVRPVSLSLMSSALVSFCGMSCWSTGPEAHSSWCTFTSWNVNPVAVLLILAAFGCMRTRRLSPVKLIFLSGFVAMLMRI